MGALEASKGVTIFSSSFSPVQNQQCSEVVGRCSLEA